VILQRFNFLAHMTLAGLVLLAFDMIGVITTWLGVIVPHAHLDTVLGLVVVIPLTFLSLAGHLALASAMTSRDRHRMTAGVLGAVVLIGVLATWSSRDDFSTALKYPSTIRPLPLSMMQAKPADDFFRDVGELRLEVDAVAAKANRKQKSR
jgi:hypothetical protein